MILKTNILRFLYQLYYIFNATLRGILNGLAGIGLILLYNAQNTSVLSVLSLLLDEFS